MANGREPSCVICAHFIHHGPANVRDPLSQCGCTLHRVALPLAATDQLLICREWKDHKTASRLVDWPKQGQYKSGILYAYPSIYQPDTAEFAKFDQLPVLQSVEQ
jgi:hypothetical protein